MTVLEPTSLRIVGPSDFIAGDCKSLELSLRAHNGELALARSDVTVSLSAEGGSILYDDASCSTQISQLTIASNENFRLFYARSERAGAMSISVMETSNGSTGSMRSLLQSSSADFFVQPASASKMRLTGERSIAATECTAYTLSFFDPFDNLAQTSETQVIELSTGGGTFFSDSSCRNLLSRLDAGRSTSTLLFYRGDRAPLPVTFRFEGQGLVTLSTQVDVRAGNLAHLQFLNPPLQVRVGECTLFTLEGQDSAGNLTTADGQKIDLDHGSGRAGTFYSDSDCATSITSVTLGKAVQISFFYKDTVPQSEFSISARGNNIQPALHSLSLLTQTPSKLSFHSGTSQLPAGSCEKYVVKSLDRFGNEVPVSLNVPLIVTLEGGTGFFFEALADCIPNQTPINSISLLKGTSRAEIFFKSTLAPQSLQLTVSSSNFTSATQAVSITPNSADQLAFVSGGTDLRVQECSSDYTIEIRDVFGNPISPSRRLVLFISAGLATEVFTDKNCLDSVVVGKNDLVLPKGETRASFFLKNKSPEQFSLLVGSSDALLKEAKINLIRVREGPGTQLALIPPVRIFSERCSSFVLKALDKGGFDSRVTEERTIRVTSNANKEGSESLFFSDSLCTLSLPNSVLTLHPNQIEHRFFFRSISIQSAEISAQDITPSVQPLLTASVAITIEAKPMLSFLGAPDQVLVDTCTPFLIQTQDSQGVAVVLGLTELTLSPSSETLTTFRDFSCRVKSATVTLPEMESLVSIYLKGTIAPLQSEKLKVSTPDFISAEKSFDVKSGEDQRLRFISGQSTLVAGSCVRYDLQSENSKQIPIIAGGTIVELSASSGHKQVFFADSVCTGSSVSRVVFPEGTSVATFYFLDSQAPQTLTVSSAASGFLSASKEISITTGRADKLVLGNDPKEVVAGSCERLTLEIQDANGNGVITNNVLVNLTTNTGVPNLYSDASCSSELTQPVQFTNSASKMEFFFRESTQKSGVVISASSDGLNQTTKSLTIVPGPATKIVFTAAPETTTAGVCFPLKVQSQDNFSNPVLQGGAVINLSNSSSRQTFFRSSACTGDPITQIEVPADQSSVSFFFRDTLAPQRNITLTATREALTSATKQIQVLTGSASKITLISPSSTLLAAQCAEIKLESQDLAGNAVPPTVATTLNLTNSTGRTTFFSDPVCAGQKIQSVNLPSTGASLSFFFQDSLAPQDDVIVSVSGMGLGSVSHALRVRTGPPSQLKFLDAPDSITAGRCVALTVQLQDSGANPVNPTTALTVDLTNSANRQTFYSSADCFATDQTLQAVIPTQSQTTTFFFRDSLAPQNSIILTARASSLQAATKTVDVRLGAIAKLSYTKAPTTTKAGDCTEFEIETRDSAGNAVDGAGTNVQILNSSARPNTLFSSSTCQGNAITSVSIASGTRRALFFFRDTFLQRGIILRIEASGLEPVPTMLDLEAGPPRVLSFTEGTSTIVKGACHPLSLKSLDAFGNVSFGTARTVILSNSTSRSTFFSTESCSEPSIGSFSFDPANAKDTFYFKDSLAPQANITLTAEALELSKATKIINIESTGSPSLTFRAGPQAVTAGACSEYQIESLGSNGAPLIVPGTVVLLSNSGGRTGTFFSDVTCSLMISSVVFPSNSSVTSFYFKDTLAPQIGITLTVSANDFSMASRIISINPGPAANLVFASGSPTVAASVCASYVLQVRDRSGNPVSVPETPVSLVNSANRLTFFSSEGCEGSPISSIRIPNSSHSVSFFFREMLAPQSLAITASSPGLSSASQTLSVQPGVATVLAFQTGPSLVVAGSCTEYKIESRDNGGNSVIGSGSVTFTNSTKRGGTFFSDSTCSTSTISSTFSPNASILSIYFKDSLAPQLGVLLTASASGFSSVSKMIDIGTGSASQLAFLAGSENVKAGLCSPLILAVRDSSGNPVSISSQNITLTSNAEQSNVFYGNVDCSGISQSTVQFPESSSSIVIGFKLLKAPRTVTLSADDGPSGLLAAQKVTSVTPGDAAQLLLEGSPTVSAGTCEQYSVKTTDVGGNPSPVSENKTVNLVNSKGRLTFFNSGCAATITSITLQAGSSSSLFSFKDLLAPQTGVEITVLATGLISATQTINIQSGNASQLSFINPMPSVLVDECRLYTIERQDSAGNQVLSGNTTFTLFNSESLPNTFFASAGCMGSSQTTFSIPSGQAGVMIYFKYPVAPRSVTLTASDTVNTLRAGTHIVDVKSRPATRLSLTGPVSGLRNTCTGPYTVQTLSNEGTATSVSENTRVYLSSTLAGQFSTSSTCSSSAFSVLIPARSDRASFYFKGLETGGTTVTADAAVLGLVGTHSVNISQETVAIKYVLSGPPTVFTGTCRSYAVTTTDGNDIPTNVSSNQLVYLSALTGSGQSAGRFFSDSLCTLSILDTTLPSGTNSKTVYFVASLSGPIELTADDEPPGFERGRLVVTVFDKALLSFSDGPTFNFGEVLVGSSSEKVLTLTNTGGTGASSVAMFDSTPVMPFSYKGGTYPGTGGTCSNNLAISANCAVVIRFAPTSGGNFTSSVKVKYFDGVNNITAERALSGSGVNRALLSISDGPVYNFGNIELGRSASKVFTITNSGQVQASAINAASLSSPFSFTGGAYPGGGTCGSTLAGGATCTIGVSFSPINSVTTSAALQLVYQDGFGSQTQTRSMTGTGITPTGGTLDTTFGSNGSGKVITNVGPGFSSASGVHIHPESSKIVMTGQAFFGHGFANIFKNQDFISAQLNPDGTLDGTYGSSGRTQITHSCSGQYCSNEMATSSVLQPDGKTLIAGSSFSSNLRQTDLFFVRLNPDGRPDLTFGVDGKKIISFGFDSHSSVNVLALQPDGRVVFAGSVTSSGNNSRAMVGRLQGSDGSIDLSFGSSGFSYPGSLGSSNSITALSLLSDGKILIGGFVLFMRLNSDGSVDPTFSGATVAQLIPNPSSIVPLPGGAFLVSGWLGRSHGSRYDNDGVVGRFTLSGSSDTSFGISGITLIDSGMNDYLTKMLVQPDSKIALAGYSEENTSVRRKTGMVIRLHASGLRDLGFGAEGIFHLTIIPTHDRSSLSSLALSPLGHLLATGSLSNRDLPIESTLVLSLTDGGVLDTTFGPNGSGFLVTPFGVSYDSVGKSLVLTDGRILFPVMALDGVSSAPAIICYDSQGVACSQFGVSGMKWIPVPAGSVVNGFGTIALQRVSQQDKILYGTSVVASSGTKSIFLVRFDTNGNVDPTFGQNGVLSVPLSISLVTTILIQSDQRIIVAGVGGNDFFLTRFLENGSSLDTSFNGSGFISTDLGGDDRPAELLIQPDGKIIAVGSNQSGSSTFLGMARYQANGVIDASFGTVGNGKVVSTDFFFTKAARLNADGKIFVAGQISSGAIRSFLANGTIDSTFGTSGTYSPSGPSFSDIQIQSDRKLLLTFGSGSNFGMTRIHPNGTADISFGGATASVSYDLENPPNSSDDIGVGSLIQTDGKIIVYGTSASSISSSQNPNIGLIRINP